MNIEQQVRVLQTMYAGALADAVLRYGREGVLEKVTREKRQEQLVNGATMAKRLGITSPDKVFSNLSEVFNCADWITQATDDGFVAVASRCMLCAIARNLGAPCPCNIYCLDAMEGMVKGIDDRATFDVQEKLWDGSQCKVKVGLKVSTS